MHSFPFTSWIYRHLPLCVMQTSIRRSSESLYFFIKKNSLPGYHVVGKAGITGFPSRMVVPRTGVQRLAQWFWHISCGRLSFQTWRYTALISTLDLLFLFRNLLLKPQRTFRRLAASEQRQRSRRWPVW